MKNFYGIKFFLMLAVGSCISNMALAMDCKKAKTKVEKTICGTPQIKQMDDELNNLYVKVVQDKGKTVASSQKTWLGERDRCEQQIVDGIARTDDEIKSCIESKYKNRIAQLQSVLDGMFEYQVIEKKDPFDIYIAYIKFNKDKVKAADKIEKEVDGFMRDSSCDWSPNLTKKDFLQVLKEDLGDDVNPKELESYETDQHIDAMAIGNKYILISYEGYSSCGGAHPNTESKYVLYDMINGESVALSEHDTLPGTMKKYEENVKKMEKQTECEEENRDWKADPKWKITVTGIDEVKVSPDIEYSHAGQACDDLQQIKIDFRAAKALFKTDSPSSNVLKNLVN